MEVKLKNVRLSFESLYEATAYQEGQQKKFGGTFLIKKDDPQVKLIKEAIEEVAKDKWGAKAEAVLEAIEGDNQKFCFADGDSPKKRTLDGFPGHYAVAAKNEKRPTVVNRRGEVVTKTDNGAPYDGCYVIVKLQFWAQSNTFGKGIRASLLGVQFMKDGDSFSGARVASVDEFEDLGEGTEDDSLL